jgi:hypothetical protein
MKNVHHQVQTDHTTPPGEKKQCTYFTHTTQSLQMNYTTCCSDDTDSAMYSVTSPPFRILCAPGQTATEAEIAELQRTFEMYSADDPHADFTHLLTLARSIGSLIGCGTNYDADAGHASYYTIPTNAAQKILDRSISCNRELAGLFYAAPTTSPNYIMLELAPPSQTGTAEGARMPACESASGNYHTHPSSDPDAILLPSSSDMVTFMRQHLAERDAVSHSLIFTTENRRLRIYACSVRHAHEFANTQRKKTKFKNRASSTKVYKHIYDFFYKLESIFEPPNGAMSRQTYKRAFVLACRLLGGIFAIFENH